MAKTIKKTFGEGEGAKTFTLEKLKVIAATGYIASLTSKLGEPGVNAITEAIFLTQKASDADGDDAELLKAARAQYLVGAVMRIVMQLDSTAKVLEVVGPLFANI